MQKSNELTELFKALAAAQGEMKVAEMDSYNPHFKSKFASLTACQKVYQEPLKKHGLSIIQMVESEGAGSFNIKTILGHSSGEWISSEFRLLIGAQSMQGLGAAVTYARRYSICAMLGVVSDEDLDGSNTPPGESATVPQAQAAPSRPKSNLEAITKPKDIPATGPQVKKLVALVQERQISGDVFRHFLKVCMEVEKPSELTAKQMESLIPYFSDAQLTEATVMVEIDRTLTERSETRK